MKFIRMIDNFFFMNEGTPSDKILFYGTLSFMLLVIVLCSLITY